MNVVEPIQIGAELGQLTSRVGRLYTKRLLDAETRFVTQLRRPGTREALAAVPATPRGAWSAWSSYLTDAA